MCPKIPIYPVGWPDRAFFVAGWTRSNQMKLTGFVTCAAVINGIRVAWIYVTASADGRGDRSTVSRQSACADV